MKLYRRLNDWANSWRTSQLLFLFGTAAVFIAAMSFQNYVISQLQAALKALTP